MFKGWKDFFYLNRGEQRAMLILFALIIVVYGMLIFSKLQSSRQSVDTVAFAKEIKAFKHQIDSAGFNQPKQFSRDNEKSHQRIYAVNEKSRPLTPFFFDPNTLTDKGWFKMGLPEKLIRTILNYTAKGGHFYQKEDLQKIYGLTASQYAVLEPFISIPPKPKTVYGLPIYKNLRFLKPPVQPVELNSVDSAGLDALRGIGPVFAMRIIRFRDLLGGYATREQLLDVYGLDSTLYQTILPYVKVDPEKIKHIDINQCPLPALRKHPYVGYYLAKAIADYRVKHMKFRSVNEVRLLPGMTPEKFKQLSPYLIVIEKN
jgi:DNA uptake protein ComE-like DNA-binding protein